MPEDARDPLHQQREREAKARDRAPLLGRLVQGRPPNLLRSATTKLETDLHGKLGRRLTKRERQQCKVDAAAWVAAYQQQKAVEQAAEATAAAQRRGLPARIAL